MRAGWCTSPRSSDATGSGTDDATYSIFKRPLPVEPASGEPPQIITSGLRSVGQLAVGGPHVYWVERGEYSVADDDRILRILR
ncbi:MAG: hypothetical protein ABI333_07505 [bacterium]